MTEDKPKREVKCIEIKVERERDEDDYDFDFGHEKRYAIADKITGEILDDAQGYGYKSIKNAYASWTYKQLDKPTKRRNSKIDAWLKQHTELTDYIDDCYFHYLKETRPEDRVKNPLKLDENSLASLMESFGIKDCPFDLKDVLKRL